ncbi:MAG: DNA recombination protein RmuC [Acidimicrobiales bacterium]
MTVGLLIGILLGLAVGVALGLLLRAHHQDGALAESKLVLGRLSDVQVHLTQVTSRYDEAANALAESRADNARLHAELAEARRGIEERTRAWEEDREHLRGAFAELSSKALETNTQRLITIADSKLKEAQETARGELGQRQEAISQMVAPLRELLTQYEAGLRDMELERKGAYTGLTEQVKQLASAQDQLKKETQNLVTALRAPQTRGRWGEMQLRRVVELVGMVEHCDFNEQVTSTTEEGRIRPDLIVHIAGQKDVVVDAKVPLEAYLRAVEAEDEATRRTHLVAHARQMRTHIDQLAKREYWKLDLSPGYVIAFVPGESLYNAACEQDGDLMEYAASKQVLIATPTTLIALLHMFALGWRDEAMAENARSVRDLGADLYERLRVLSSHLGKMHRSLASTVEAYNDTVGSLEARVLPTARKFPGLSVVAHGAKEIEEALPVTSIPRLPQAPELVEGEDHVEELDGPPPARSTLELLSDSGEEAELPGVSGVG